MQNSLEVYFEVCEKQGKAPDKPFSDRTYALPLEVPNPPDKGGWGIKGVKSLK